MLISLDGSDVGLDIDEMTEAFELIQSLPDEVRAAVTSAMERLTGEVRLLAPKITSPFGIRPYIILLDSPITHDISNHASVLGPSLVAFSRLDSNNQRLVRSYYVESFSKDKFIQVLAMIQDFIALRTLDAAETFNPHTDTFVSSAVVFLSLLHDFNKRRRHVKFDAFYSDSINDNLRKEDDFINWKKPARGFSYVNYPFVLSAETKSFLLQIESEVQQYRERQEAFNLMMVTGIPVVPYLVLKVFRQNLIHSSLEQLSHQPESNLKKKLKIQFVGEEGVDEGGLQKEWFQLLVKQIFSPAYGMFTEDSESRTHWFNGHSTDFDEFELIGKLIGIAIYNSNILDLHFPQVVYKKLLGMKPTLDDMFSTHPTLAKGLKQLLEHSGEVEETFGLNYAITYDYFGAVETHELIPGGATVSVTSHNREDYVNRYVQYLLEDSVEKQFSAFHRGFRMVCSDSEIMTMFSPEELEQVVCGDPKLDFDELRKNTQYDGGFDENSPTIKDFWIVVSEFSEEQKRKLLMFSTGSDRAPIGGLKKLAFTITRGTTGDTDRLPTSHTCFNVLILYEYATRDKLKNCLLKALEHSEGFGNL
eukprot:TRINITY_DN3339_c0_g1_i3.p1 TRINITY_DN3339_c0_g1~~TRINITY_DN3339_c0_g1_i3.p1  ORF type:complete len:589 (+),score=96.77 TRINITY_DN3339_c0_g1_i3:540-2306(+)